MAKPKTGPIRPKMPLAKPQQQMTRADSLQSMAKFGKIVSPAEQKAMKPKKKGLQIPFLSKITDALDGK